VNLGRSAKLGIKLVEQGALKHLADMMKSRNVQVPSEIDLMNRARVHFLDTYGHEVAVDAVLVVWEEG
jgi:hypothetical protein